MCPYCFVFSFEQNTGGGDEGSVGSGYDGRIDMGGYDAPTQSDSPNIAFQPTSLWGHLPSPKETFRYLTLLQITCLELCLIYCVLICI